MLTQDVTFDLFQVCLRSDPYPRDKFPNDNVLVHFWRNVWETGHVYDAYKLANEGYQVRGWQIQYSLDNCTLLGRLKYRAVRRSCSNMMDSKSNL